jgi:hypothetical protein
MEANETMFHNLPERLLGLGEIAENLWWSWHLAGMERKQAPSRAMLIDFPPGGW